MGKAGASVLSEQYRDGQDAEAYIRGMTKAYNAGKNGTSRAELINDLPSGIDGTQARSAYIAGQADATSNASGKKPLARGRAKRYNGKCQGGTDADGLRSR